MATSRKNIPSSIQVDVLEKSARRCCICYVIDFNYDVKEGQIAHLDKVNSNNELDNLVFLCLNHHNDFDSRTSQSKNYSIREVKRYREMLYNIVADLRKKQSNTILTRFEKKETGKKSSSPFLPDMEFIAYYTNDRLKVGEKTNMNFKLTNNSSNSIQCTSYKFEGYYQGQIVATYNKHVFNLTLKQGEEKIFPFGSVNPITAYFKNHGSTGDFESKIYIGYRVNGTAEKIKVGVARISIR